MSTNNANDKTASLEAIESINAVDGFDPSPFAVDYTDLNSSETRKRLPVVIQMAWFRIKYPEGKIAVIVEPGKDCYVANARVYPNYKDSPECFLAEATASRGYCADKPSVSPREWAQTAAIGIALRNAGFGLQFGMDVRETEKAYVFRLIDFQSRYSAADIEYLFQKSKRIVIRKAKSHHAIRVWSDEDFTVYPFQAGIPYYFERAKEAHG